MNRRCTWAALALFLAWVGPANADAPLELGNRIAVSGSFSVTFADPEPLGQTRLYSFGSTLTRSSADARFEYGIGLAVAAKVTDARKIAIVTPSAQIRMNSDWLGPRENVLAYAGLVAGVSLLDVDVDGGHDLEDESGAFGPKFGVEYYVFDDIAIQFEDTLLFDTNQGLMNSVTLGLKYLF